MLIIVMYQDVIQEVRQYQEFEELEGYFDIKTLKVNKDYRIIHLDEEKKPDNINHEPVDWLHPKTYKPNKEEED